MKKSEERKLIREPQNRAASRNQTQGTIFDMDSCPVSFAFSGFPVLKDSGTVLAKFSGHREHKGGTLVNKQPEVRWKIYCTLLAASVVGRNQTLCRLKGPRLVNAGASALAEASHSGLLWPFSMLCRDGWQN